MSEVLMRAASLLEDRFRFDSLGSEVSDFLEVLFFGV
jgi:hypothetical protein